MRNILISSALALLAMATLLQVSSVPIDVQAGVIDKHNASMRFIRDCSKVITDQSTGLQWLEGPDMPMNPEQARKWIDRLGDEWRMPTVDELRNIFQKNSKRLGGSKFPDGPWYIGLDPAFRLENAYCVWSLNRTDNSIVGFGFVNGVAHNNFNVCTAWYDRVFAVR